MPSVGRRRVRRAEVFLQAPHRSFRFAARRGAAFGRRRAALRVGVVVTLVAAPVAAVAAPSPLRVVDLRCESLVDPIGIDVISPRLSWRLESTRRGEMPSASRVLVASSPERLQVDQADLWDSGKQATHLPWLDYAGPPLGSGVRAHWKVQVWDRDDRPSEWSTVARWEMGLLHATDWQARWIGASDASAPPLEPMPASAAWIWHASGGRECVVRKRLALPAGAAVQRAQILVAAPQTFELHANGRRLGAGGGLDSLSCIDATAALAAGDNVLAVHATGGRVVVAVTVVLAGGRRIVVRSDATWRTAAATDPGWSAVATPDESWPRAQIVGSYATARVPLPPRAAPAPLLRRTFRIDKPVSAARAYVCGLGFGELWVNGARADDRVLDPAFTRYDRRVLYATYDITSRLRPGSNTVGLVLGHGWYDQHAADAWGFETAPWRASPRALCQIHLTDADGKMTVVATDSTWQLATGPIVFDGIRNGETYDARRERPDWAAAGAAGAGWRPARVVSAPSGRVSAQMQPPIRVTETLAAERLAATRPGLWVYDFGVNIAGWARLRVRAPAGTAIVLRYGERVDESGALDRALIAKHLRQGPFQTDRYIARGGGSEQWEPRFTYHGFRYVEMSGAPSPPALADLEARVVHTDFAPAGNFHASDPLVNAIFAAALRAYRSNFVGIPTDCPQREKNGWTADAHLAAEQAMFHFANVPAYRQWVQSLWDEQAANGALPGIVPTPGWGYEWGNGPVWDAALFLVPWYVYVYTGDARLLQASAEPFARYLDHVRRQSYLDSARRGWLGDWQPAGATCPDWVVQLAYHIEITRIAAAAARLRGDADAARAFESERETLQREIGRRVSKREELLVHQTAIAALLFAGATSGRESQQLGARLAADVEARGLDCGIIGARLLLHALSDAGRPDLAYRVVTDRGKPGWARWIDHGATTLWEDWSGAGSLNHAYTSDVAAWFQKNLAGIRPDPARPGFEHVTLRPQFVAGLDEACGETHTVRGRVACCWTRRGDAVQVRVAIPPGATASLHLPARQAADVTERGIAATRADGVTAVRRHAGEVVIEMGSGDYEFAARIVE